MKKFLLFLLFCCFVPPTAHANDSVFNSNAAFSLAKVVKLGRGSSYSVQAAQEVAGNDVSAEIINPCDEHCTKCDLRTAVCSQCSEGRYLSNNLCPLCSTIPVSNATCSACSQSGKCTAATCKSGYYKLNAIGKDSLACGVCPAGTYINGGSCAYCSSGTFTSGQNQSSCSVCSSIKIAVGNSGTTVDCSSCSSTGKCTAFTCPTGYYSNGTKCVNCPTGCSSCSSASSCSACSSGYFLKGGTCHKEIPCCSYCSSCDKTTGTCSSCNGGYYLSGNTCYKEKSCGSNCANCDKTTGNCRSCNSGYYLSGGSCYQEKSCCSYCSSCDKKTGKCSACQSGYSLGSNGSFCEKKTTSGSNPGGGRSCPSGTTYKTNVRVCSTSTFTYTGCVPSDFGKSCSNSSQCSRRLCAPCYDSSGRYVAQGSTCR